MESVDAKKIVTLRNLGITLFLLWPLLLGIFGRPLSNLWPFAMIGGAIFWLGLVIIISYEGKEKYWFALLFTLISSTFVSLIVIFPNQMSILIFICSGFVLLFQLYDKFCSKKVKIETSPIVQQTMPRLNILFGISLLLFLGGLIIGAVLNVK